MIESQWFGRPVTKPGYGEPEPVKPVSTMDSPENVETCLNCSVPGGCRAELSICPLRNSGRSKKIQERYNKIRDLINAGWVNADAICEEAGVTKWVYNSTRRRLRERGEIT